MYLGGAGCVGSCIDVNIGAVLGCKSVTTLRYYVMFLAFIVVIFVDLVTMSIFCSICVCVCGI